MQRSVLMFLRFMRYALYAVAVVCAILCMLVAGVIYALHYAPFKGAPFDSAAWRSALTCDSDQNCVDKELACARGPMVADIADRLEDGHATREGTTAMLGAPSMDRSVPRGCVDYELGMCSGIKIDTDYLRICFDEENKVKQVFHWQS